MASDFARPRAPKDKAHLESSHRSLHNFEIKIIKAFEDRISDTVADTIFNRGKKEKITVTLLDITLKELKESPLIEEYRNEHNNNKHYFSEKAEIREWIPAQKLDAFLAIQADPLTFTPDQVQEYVKYGFRKIKATVSKKRTIRHKNRDYYVTCGAELFSRHKSTPVQISIYRDKLFIFEQGEDGILLGKPLPDSLLRNHPSFQKKCNLMNLTESSLFWKNTTWPFAGPPWLRFITRASPLPGPNRFFIIINHAMRYTPEK